MPAKKKPEAVQDAIIEPATPVDIVRALIRSFGREPSEIAGVDISGKYVRLFGKDRSLNSRTIGTEWNAKEEDADD